VTNETDIYIYTFASLEIQYLERFKNYWLKGHKETPEDFPIAMSHEEWHEHFTFYLSSHGEQP
jgi:hypothetical protein